MVSFHLYNKIDVELLYTLLKVKLFQLYNELPGRLSTYLPRYLTRYKSYDHLQHLLGRLYVLSLEALRTAIALTSIVQYLLLGA